MNARDYEQMLGRELLASVSRSFYLSLRALPGRMRGPVSLAYLLARATDTIADTPGPVSQRLHALDALLDHISSKCKEPINLAGFPKGGTVGEQKLLDALPQCLEWLKLLEPCEQKDVRWVLQKIGGGQRLDITRFEDGPLGVASSADLWDYTYLVAGSVGEFWTRMALRAFPCYATRSTQQMLEDGKALGRGLQLVNILRDHPRDLAQGRCYLPADELPADWNDPEAVRAVYVRWLAHARAELDIGHRYCKAVRVRRVRFACLVPVHAGNATLDLLESNYAVSGLKISRATMRACLWRALRQSL